MFSLYTERGLGGEISTVFFKRMHMYGREYDPISGRRLFEYYLQPGMVTIKAYIGKYKKPYLLDDSFAGSIPKSAYKELLAPLLQPLSGYNMPGGGNGQTGADNYNDFANAKSKSQEKLAVWGFVLSIIDFLLSFVGYALGLVRYVQEFYFAACGLKMKKKGFAIATFVLAGISTLILLVSIFLQALA